MTVRGTFRKKDFQWKNIRGYRFNFWRNGSFVRNLNEKAEAATDSYSVTGDSLQFIYSVHVTKNHRNIRSRCSVHEFSFTDIFLTILIMFTEQLYWRKNFCGCFRFIWLWLLISIKFIIRDLDSQHKIHIVLWLLHLRKHFSFIWRQCK